jgi:hypothetical protein
MKNKAEDIQEILTKLQDTSIRTQVKDPVHAIRLLLTVQLAHIWGIGINTIESKKNLNVFKLIEINKIFI